MIMKIKKKCVGGCTGGTKGAAEEQKLVVGKTIMHYQNNMYNLLYQVELCI